MTLNRIKGTGQRIKLLNLAFRAQYSSNNMRSINAEETLGSLAPLKNMLRKFFVKSKVMTQRKQNSQQVMSDKDQEPITCKDQGISDDIVMFQTIISRKLSTKSLETSICAQNEAPQNNSNSCLHLEERIVQRKISLPSGKVEEEVFYTQCVDVRSSSESRVKPCFEPLYLEEQIHRKITSSQFHLVYNLDYGHSDTRLVDGLLTTTLCSTEL